MAGGPAPIRLFIDWHAARVSKNAPTSATSRTTFRDWWCWSTACATCWRRPCRWTWPWRRTIRTMLSSARQAAAVSQRSTRCVARASFL